MLSNVSFPVFHAFITGAIAAIKLRPVVKKRLCYLSIIVNLLIYSCKAKFPNLLKYNFYEILD